MLRIFVFTLIICLCLNCYGIFASESAKQIEEELLGKARSAIDSGDWTQFKEEITKKITEFFKNESSLKQADTISLLFYFNRVGLYFPTYSEDNSKAFLNWLLNHKDMCWRFLNALDKYDDPGRAFGVLKNLYDMGEERILQFSELAIAYAVVWDNYNPVPIEGKDLKSGSYKETYDYYTKNIVKMNYDLRKVPWIISQYIVNSLISSQERTWVLENYKQNVNISNCYSEVEYDSNYLESGSKKISGKPYTLMNINELGGVCSDRAYYAVSIVQVYGVPAAVIGGSGARGSHAWVGFIDINSGQAVWNVDVGRYSSDKYYQGSIFEPKSNQNINDSEFMMTAALFNSNFQTQNTAVAFRDAAKWLFINLDKGTEDFGESTKEESSTKNNPKVFSLVSESLRLSPYDRDTWLFLAGLGKCGYLTFQQMDSSFTLIRQLTIHKYPEFSYVVFEKLVSGIKDSQRQNDILNRIFDMFRSRPDLGANVKILQGEVWEKSNKDDNAIKAYSEAITMFRKESHVVTNAFQKLDELYKKGKKTQDAIRFYYQTWSKLETPTSKFGYETCLYKIMGDRLIELLTDSGKNDAAQKIKSIMERVEKNLTWEETRRHNPKKKPKK